MAEVITESIKKQDFWGKFISGLYIGSLFFPVQAIPSFPYFCMIVMIGVKPLPYRISCFFKTGSPPLNIR
jgi:hypothetical protein